jgi:hypothetical protein
MGARTTPAMKLVAGILIGMALAVAMAAFELWLEET